MNISERDACRCASAKGTACGRLFRYLIVFSLFCPGGAFAQTKTQTRQATTFTVVPLGIRGGLDESNLSAYMLAPAGSQAYICLDAGTLYSGIRKAVDSGVFTVPASQVQRQYIKAYFISHPHLDHVAGLIINSPDDSAKSIYGMASCLNVLAEKYFTWESWANFADEGEKPLLKKYHYSVLVPGQEVSVGQTALQVTAYPLSHGVPYESAAFLVRGGADYVLYLGDTGADTIEHSDKLHKLWQQVAPLVKTGHLKAVFIEVSFPDEQPDKFLFGHLTPRLLMEEMKELGALSGGMMLRQVPILITHEKPSGNQESRIRQQLGDRNALSLKIVFPEQGKRIDL